MSTRSGPGEKHQAVFADLDLVAVGQHRRLHRFTVEIGAVEAADVDYPEFAILRRNSAWRRLTVTSSRKMSLPG